MILDCELATELVEVMDRSGVRSETDCEPPEDIDRETPAMTGQFITQH